MAEAMIKIENLSYRYPRTKKWVLKDISIEIHKGEFIAIMGENGAGKTTFCQCLNGVIPHSHEGKLKGVVTVDGMVTAETPISKLADSIGMVLEDPETQLFTTIIRNEVAFGPENLNIPIDEIKRRVNWALEVVGLTEYIDEAPTALSGGQKQRLAIAAALAMLPKVLVLDEPTSQLDPIGTREVYNVIREIREKHDITIVMATHKSEEIAEFADKVLVIKDGQVAAFDKPWNIFNDEQLLKDNWIRPPQVSALTNYLNDRGEMLEKFPVLLEDAVTEIMKWYKGERV